MNKYTSTVAFFLLALFIGPKSYSTTVDDYQFPFQNTYWATITSAINSPDKTPYQVVALEPHPERRHLPLVQGKNIIKLILYAQKKPAPLIIVIPGVGGGADSGSSLLIAETLYKNGFSALTLPNPFSWQFVLGASETGITGYLPQDSKELYAFIKLAVTKITKQHLVQPTNYGVTGYSLGGMLIPFLIKQDNQEQFFKFKKALLINTPVDMNYGMNTLDKLYAMGDNMSLAHKQWVQGTLLGIGEDIFNSPNRGAELLKHRDYKPFSEEDIKWVVGQSFRENLRDVIFASQQIRDIGLLKTPASDLHRNARLAEAMGITFHQYLMKAVFPQYNNGFASVDDFVTSSSLYANPEILADPRVMMLHNADDFIIRHEDLDYLDKTFGDRLTMYPCGGHVGNLWMKPNQKMIVEAFKDLL